MKEKTAHSSTPHLVLVFLEKPSRDAFVAEARRIVQALRALPGADLHALTPDETKLALLVMGTAESISSTLEASKSAYTCYLVMPAASGHISAGLGATDVWLHRHRMAAQK